MDNLSENYADALMEGIVLGFMFWVEWGKDKGCSAFLFDGRHL